MYHAFANSVIDLLFLGCVSIWIDVSLNKRYSRHLMGFLFGVITIFLMQSHIIVGEGRLFDFRHIALTMAGFIGGPSTAVIAVIMSSLYRHILGGNGALGGIANIIIFGSFGIALGHYFKSKEICQKPWFLFFIGIIMACMLLFILEYIAPWLNGRAPFIGTVTWLFLITTPFLVTIIFKFFFWAKDFLSKASILDTIINQEQLRVATDRFQKVFQLGPHMMSILRKSDFAYIDVTDRFLEERDFRREDIIGKTPFEMGIPETQFYQIIKAIELQGSVRNIECSVTTKLGSKNTIIISAETIQIDGQECILFAYNNVTEMKRLQTEKLEQLEKYLILEADLSRSNQLIAGIINSMPDSFYVLDDQDRFIYINNQAEELLQKPRKTLLGQVCWEHFPQVKGTLLERYYNKAKKDGLPFTFEYGSILHKNKWYQITGYPSQFGISVYYRDITEQILASENLNKSKEETISVLESMTDSFFSINENWKFTYINGSAEKAFGKSREELLGKKLTEVFNLHETSLLNYQAAMDEKRSITYEIRSEMLGNIWVEIKLYPIENGLNIYFQDISNRKKSEDEMARLDRLNLVGQLAAGIGHEIRNPLTTIRGYLQLIGDKPDYAILKPTFDLMISEVDRANSIITEFLSLAQTKKTELKLQSLTDILNLLFPLLQADAFSQNKQLRFILRNTPHLELNSKEINQLILNLARNGLEAMEERGCLTIQSYLQHDKVVLAIDDEGCGIPPENSKKIGTPFFTTKDTGTGLGLATCYRIVEAHGAEIRVDSSSKGTTFYISFPIPDKDQNANHMIA